MLFQTVPMCHPVLALYGQSKSITFASLLFPWLSSDLSSVPSPGGQSVFQCPEWAQPRKQRERRGKKRRGEEGYSRGMQEVSGRGFSKHSTVHSGLIHTYVYISFCLCMPSVSYTMCTSTCIHTHIEVCQSGCVRLLFVKDAQPWQEHMVSFRGWKLH